MASNNPFRQPVPKLRELLLETRLNLANEQGKDISSGHSIRVVATKDFLWLGGELSVPLAWLEIVEPAGSGLRFCWRNEIEGTREHIFLCARSMFSYNLKERDRIVSEVQKLTQNASSSIVASFLEAAKTPMCEKCSLPSARIYDYIVFIGFFMMWVKRPERKLLCEKHALRNLWMVVLVNAAFAILCVPSMVLVPIFNYSQSKRFRDQNLISTGSLYTILAVSCIPVVTVLSIVAYAIVKSM